MLSNLILLTCLNRYLLVLCYTIVISSLNRLNLNSVPELVAPFRSLSLSSFLSSESRSNACIDYAESQKKYSRARTTASLFRRFIFRLGFRSGFFRVARAEASLLGYAESREKT